MSEVRKQVLEPIEPRVEVEDRGDGVLLLRSPYQPGSVAKSTAHILLERATQIPERTLLAERRGEGWERLSYKDAANGAKRVAQWLLDQGASVERPLAILSASSIQHFLMAWGAILARVPYVPVSLSYSTVKGAYPKLAAVLDTVRPAFVFAETLSLHMDALAAIEFDLSRVTLVTGDPSGTNLACTTFPEVYDTVPTGAVEESVALIDHDTVTRYMFTSGSTGMPKGVIVTQGMTVSLLAAGEGLRDTPDLGDPPRVLDWMPWSHVGAGVMRLSSMINAGGSIYLDTGKPTHAEFHKTLENLKSVRPTSFAGAPLGWSMLVDALERDEDLAMSFYENIKAMQSGSAAMPAALAKRIQALNVKYTGHEFPFGTSLLSTEVHVCLNRYWPTPRTDVVGLPGPGAELKLVPFVDDRYELRVRGPGVTAGYLNDEKKTTESFDEEGFFKMGDAVRFADAADPTEGLCFAGRVAEEFKLVTGTWVSAGTLRADAVTAASPYVRDVVVCGLNENYVGLLIWPNLEACAQEASATDPVAICASPNVRDRIAEGLRRHNDANPGSSRAVRRFVLLAEPPDPGANEITDKGYVNQSEAQRCRAVDLQRLFAEPADQDVIVL